MTSTKSDNTVSVHEMRLKMQPFDSIKSGEKIYELRLYDEKRQKIKLGDYIVFTAENDERLTVKVTDILRFNDFVKLYTVLPKTQIGYKPHEIADPEDMAQYYAEDEIKKYGVVALKIELANQRR